MTAPLQSFEETARPEQGPPRLAALREALAAARLDGFLVPRADMHQGEYVAAHDARLAWLTGFTGSSGFAIALADRAGVFTDGRYKVQVRAQVDTAHFTPVDWPATKPGDWLRDALPEGGRIGFDPWLHTPDEIDKLTASLDESGVVLERSDNLVDAIWAEQPAKPCGAVRAHPEALAGEAASAKRARLADDLRAEGLRAAVLTLPDSVAWLLNIRGADIPRNPVVHACAILHDDGAVALFIDAAKLDAAARAHLGDGVTLHAPDSLESALAGLTGPLRLDPASAPVAVADRLAAAGVAVAPGRDPCLLPKARKTAAELDGMRAAHLRDAAAMVEFLAWFDAEAPSSRLTEIDAVRELEARRRATGQLRDLSFDTIAGAGPHGAIVHYRVTEATNRAITPGELFLLDSGGQYDDGTTDITRTIAVGAVGAEERAIFTRVLQGMIAISRLRFPEGVTGAHLDALARYPLWLVGRDYDHGTGHGVGAALSVHEGPQRFSRLSDVVLEPGMILSNEPGCYREGAYGIRIENLVALCAADPVAGGDDRAMLCVETLTWVPIDRRLIDPALLSDAERAWVDAYHAEVYVRVAPQVGAPARDWLRRETEKL